MPSCTICGSPTIRVSPVARLGAKSGFSWEHDSSMQLLGLTEVESSLHVCSSCLHAIIFPVFDAARLYGREGAAVRKAVYESYYPDMKYTAASQDKLDAAELFRKSARDLRRFTAVAEMASRHIKGAFPDADELRILDWGGGDGYISTVYASVMQAVSGIPASNVIYDFTEWDGVGAKRASLEELEGQRFHFVILSGILEHTHDLEETLRSASAFLHEGGVVLCEVPDERYTIANAILRRQRFGLHYHVCSFSRRSLHVLMEKSGLSNTHVVLQKSSSYRGKPIRFFVGIGQKRGGESVSGTAPSRLSAVCSLIGYVTGMVTSKVWRVVSSLARKAMQSLLRARSGEGER